MKHSDNAQIKAALLYQWLQTPVRGKYEISILYTKLLKWNQSAIERKHIFTGYRLKEAEDVSF